MLYQDPYEVWVSTTSNHVNDFLTNGTMVYNEAPTLVEEDILNYRTVDLSTYAGQTIYIAIRHVAYDLYWIFFDDIAVTAGPVPSKSIATPAHKASKTRNTNGDTQAFKKVVRK